MSLPEQPVTRPGGHLIGVVVVAAFGPELTRFRELCQGEGLETRTEAVGVGVVDAAAGAAAAIARLAPERVLLLGTCGAFDGDGLGVGDVVVVQTARLVDLAIARGAAALPAPMEAGLSIALDPQMRATFEARGARPVQCANTIGVTIDDGVAAELAQTLRSADDEEQLPRIEHLEAFAVARSCALASVPCAIVLGVANRVGASGRAEWCANHVEASARAAEVAIAALKEGAPDDPRTSTRSRSRG